MAEKFKRDSETIVEIETLAENVGISLSEITATTVKNAIKELANNKADSASVLTKTNTINFTPTGNYQPATKKYVDDSVSTASSGGITKITVGGAEQSKTGTTVNLPAYPTKISLNLNYVTNDAQVKRSEMGASGGVATLDSTGKVPSTQLPSYANMPLSTATQTALNLKVDKVNGKSLSTNDYTSDEKAALAANTTARHSHPNKSVLDNITSALITSWNNAVTDLLSHVAASGNVHNLSKDDIGLSKVENLTVNEQSPDFTIAVARVNVVSGENLSTLFGKISKWFNDLKAVAFSGAYTDLSGTPTSLPANGGNADTVNGKTVLSSVPSNAKFTDTIYVHPSTHPYSILTDAPTSLPANGGNAATVNDKIVLSNVPANAIFTDTVYTHPNTHPYSMITDAPTSLPANGGNADTVDGKHVNDAGLTGVLWTSDRIKDELAKNLPTGAIQYSGTVIQNQKVVIAIPSADDYKSTGVEVLCHRGTRWDRAIHGIDYVYGFIDTTHIEVEFLTAGQYKVNYSFCSSGETRLVEISSSIPDMQREGDFWYERLNNS